MRGCWLLVSLPLAACAIPERDNAFDPSNRPPQPVARLRVADATNPAAGYDGECLPAGTEASWPSATDVPAGRCVVLDAGASELPGGEGLFSFFRLDGTVEEDVEIAWLGSGASAVLVLTTAQKAAVPLDEILRFRVDVDDGNERVSARVLARFTNEPPLITMSPPRSLPLGPYTWTAATTIPVTFTAEVYDPDLDRIAWCWTLPGAPPGDPEDPATCEVSGAGPPENLPSLTLDVPILEPGELAVHLVVSDGTRRSLPATGIVAVRDRPVWVQTLGGAAAMDPQYSRVSPGFVQWIGPFGADGVGLAVQEGPSLRLKLAPSSDLAAVGAGGGILTCYPPISSQCFFPDNTYIGTNPNMSFAIDPSSEEPQAVWITHPGTDGRVRVAAVPPSQFSFFGLSTVVTTSGDPVFAPVAVGDGVVWIATADGVRAWDALSFDPLGAVPPPGGGMRAHAIAARPFTSGFHEAFVIWSPTLVEFSPETVLARYTLPDGGTLSAVEDPFPGLGDRLAFAARDGLWAVLPDELVLLDASTSPVSELAAVPASNVGGVACQPATGVCSATAANGSIALELYEDGSSRIHGVSGQNAPLHRQYGMVYSLEGNYSATLSVGLAPTQGFASGDVFGGSGLATVWTAQANRLEEYSASGERLRILQEIPAGAETVPLSNVLSLAVEPDDRALWLCADDENGVAAVWRVDLELSSGARLEDVPNCFRSELFGAPQDAGFLWMYKEGAGLGTLDSSGAFNMVSDQWYPVATSPGSTGACVARTVLVGTNGEIGVDVARLAADGVESAFVSFDPIYGTPPGVVLDLRISASENPPLCWVSVSEDDGVGSLLTEVWSVDANGVATQEVITDDVVAGSGYLYANPILASGPDRFWLMGNDPLTGEARLERFDRGSPWVQTRQKVELPIDFVSP